MTSQSSRQDSAGMEADEMKTVPESTIPPASRVLILGLDGATWALINPLIRAGRLPNLAGLIEGGSKGVLESTIPPVTASAWSSFYTGRSPGAHGVFDFRKRMERETHERRMVTAGSINGPKFWDIASVQGKTVGLINLPLTFPPFKVDGYMIGGMPVPPTRDDIGYPEGLVDEIVKEMGEYISDIDLFRGECPDVTDPDRCMEFVNAVEHAAVIRGRATEYLMDKYPSDLTFCVLVTPDRLSHLFWKIMSPGPSDPTIPASPPLKEWETRLQERIYEVFGQMDAVVGNLIGRMNGNDLVVVMSDHGFGPLNELLKMNSLLRDLGYLKLSPVGEGSIKRRIGRVLPEWIKKPLRGIMGLGKKKGGKPLQDEGSQFDPYLLFDWSETKAYSGGSVEQGIFINVDGREPEGTVLMGAEYHRVRDRLISELRKVIHPRDGEPLFDWVEPRENVYSGEHVENAPDIMYCLRDHSMVIGEDVEPPMIGPWSQPRAGFHRRDGILILKGPMIKKGIELKMSRIEDVALTILACWGLASDAGMDGALIRQAIDPGFIEAYPERRERFEESGDGIDPSDSDAEQMEDLLKGLGYLN